jgi:hypothetical protein
MENENKRATDYNAESQNDWENAEQQGDWQLAESDADDTAEMLTTYQAEGENPRLYAAGDDSEDKDDEDDQEEEEEPRDWGHTDPLDSPLPDSTDPSGPGSAV